MATCNEKVWKALVAVAQAREAAKAREAELVLTRRDVEGRLDELGAGETKDHLRVSRDYVVTCRQLEYERNRLKTLADQMEAVIRAGIQGKFDFADSISESEINRRPTEADLFHPAPEPEHKPAETRPVGRPGKTKPQVPDPSKGDGVDEHLKASVNELDIREDLKGKLIDAGLTTVGHIAAILDKDEHAHIVEGFSQNANAAVKKAVKAFRKEHRAAMRDVEEFRP